MLSHGVLRCMLSLNVSRTYACFARHHSQAHRRSIIMLRFWTNIIQPSLSTLLSIEFISLMRTIIECKLLIIILYHYNKMTQLTEKNITRWYIECFEKIGQAYIEVLCVEARERIHINKCFNAFYNAFYNAYIMQYIHISYTRIYYNIIVI